jgi:hypothetical protein
MAHPEAFYKYLSAEGTESALRSGRLRWSSPLLFDDPAEFQRIPRFSPSLEEAGSKFVSALVNLAAGGLRLDEERLSTKTRFVLGNLRLLIESGLSREELIKQIGVTASNSDERFEAEMKGLVERLTLESTRVLCVTVDRYGDAMWDKYAEKRRGALLEFRHVPEYSTPLLAAKQVMYAAERAVMISTFTGNNDGAQRSEQRWECRGNDRTRCRNYVGCV